MSKVSGSNVPSERLTQLNQLGFQLFQEKLYPQALEVLQQVVDLTQGQLGPTHAELGVALLNRGRVYRLLERNAECEADYHQALEILRLSPATHQDQIIWLLRNLIALYRNTGRRSAAEPSVRELLAVQRTALPPDDPRLADLLVDLGGACYERGALQEANGLLREALAIREATLGPGHPQTVELRDGLAGLEASAETPSPSAPSSEGTSTDAMDRFNNCMRAFLGRDYPVMVERALALISDGTITHGLLQMLLIALQRSGQAELLSQVAAQVPQSTEGVPWERALLELTLGHTEPNTVLSQAQDDAQRGQIFYYTAERMITVGHPEKALDLLRHALELLPKGLERILAIGAISPLQSAASTAPLQPPPGTAVDRQVSALNEEATELFRQGKAREALPLFEKISALRRNASGGSDPVYAATLYDLGAVHLVLGELDKAESQYRAALALQEATLGADHPSALATRRELAGVLAARGDLDTAAVMNRQVLAAEKKAGAHHTAEWADMALTLARYCRAKGDPGGAASLLRDALDVLRELNGVQAPATLEVLDHLVGLLINRRQFAEADSFCLELVDARRANREEQPSELADALDSMAQVAAGLGDSARAESLWQESLATSSKAPSVDAVRTARTLNRLGVLCRTKGQLAQGTDYLRQALDVAEKATPRDESMVNGTLANLASLLHDQGRLGESEELYRRVLKRLATGLGADPRDLAGVRNNLAMLLRSSGRFTEAESLLLEALDANRGLRGNRDPETVRCVANLGLLYYEMGLYDRAEPLLKEALALRQDLLDPGDPDLGESLQNLGEFYRATGRLDLAELMLNQALAIWSAAGAERHPSRATTLNNLALLSMARQDWTRAEQLYLQTIDFRREVLGDSHADLATSLDTLSELYRVTGRYAEADRLCRQGLQMRRALLGDTHPDISWSLNNLALIEAASGRHGQAFDLLCESNTVDDRLIAQVFAVGSEAQRLQFLDHLRNRCEIFLSLVLSHLAARPQAVHKAFELVLRRKGLAAEALAVQRDVSLSASDPRLTSQLHELSELRHELGAKTLAGPAPGETLAQHQEVLARWQSRREALEAGLARELPSVGWEKRLLQVGAAAVCKALPQERALVEFVRLDIRDFAAVPSHGQTEWQPARYVAFVMLPRDPDAITMVDLSNAEVLDQCVAELRVSITGDLTYSRARTTESEFDAGTELRRRVFDPLLPALGGSTKVLLSPDGDLAMLPMEVLPRDDGGRLIDRFELSYVSSGRDLLRMGLPIHGEAGAPVVAADPDFDLAGEGGTTMAFTGRYSRDLDRGHGATRLVGTRQEGEAIADLLGVRPSLGAEVVEARFRELISPAILHLATHGFFMKNQTGLRAPPGLDPPRVENPMLRSGLLLAGFNTWLSHGPVPAGVDDGMLNGEDVAGLNLLDTELAVLSACETGLGDIHVGEGVFGLRRAFMLAGARTLVMSLWKVPDEQTRELMIEFYRRILAGEPRAAALRQAQLKIKTSHPDPVNWAAFICQGDIGPLSLQRPFDAHGSTSS